MDALAGYVDGLPSLCGQEPLISEAIAAGRQRPVFPGGADIEGAASTFAVALHMHQPLIPPMATACVPRGSSATWRG
jgi:hypothetical protein